MCYLVPGPLPCPEVVAVSYIRPAEVPTLFSAEGEAQVERQNTVVGLLTLGRLRTAKNVRYHCRYDSTFSKAPFYNM